MEYDLRAVLGAMMDAVVLFDHEGRIELLNFTGQDMFGYNEADAIGLTVSTLLAEQYRSREDSLGHDEDIDEPRIVGVGRELLAKRRDGSDFWVELVVGRIKGTEPHRFVAVIRDITVRRNAEAARRRGQALPRLS